MKEELKLYFSWSSINGLLTPTCHSNESTENRICFLSSILMDDGGLGHLDSIPWLDEGLKRIDSLISGQVEAIDWSREAWASEFKKNRAKIYSLHMESCYRYFDLDLFRKALLAWRDFIQSNPESGQKLEVDLCQR